MMKIKILKNVTVDCIDTNGNYDDILFPRGKIVEVTEIIPKSRLFCDIMIMGGKMVIDIRKDSFQVVE